jgi:hypothetical protein
MPHLKQGPNPDLLGFVHSAQVALWGEVLVVVFVMATAAHLVDSSAVMFTAMEHLVSASGIVAVCHTRF